MSESELSSHSHPGTGQGHQSRPRTIRIGFTTLAPHHDDPRKSTPPSTEQTGVENRCRFSLLTLGTGAIIPRIVSIPSICGIMHPVVSFFDNRKWVRSARNGDRQNFSPFSRLGRRPIKRIRPVQPLKNGLCSPLRNKSSIPRKTAKNLKPAKLSQTSQTASNHSHFDRVRLDREPWQTRCVLIYPLPRQISLLVIPPILCQT